MGVGWLKEEFEAIGVSFAHRGKRADEYLQALKQVWTGEEVNYHGEFLNWQGFMMRPRPAQPGGIPLVIGGVTPAAIRRLVRYGDGWYVIGKDLDDYRAHMRAFHVECQRQGRSPSEIEITAYWNYYGEGRESLAVYKELGVHRLLVNMRALRDRDVTTAMERFGEEVVTKYS